MAGAKEIGFNFGPRTVRTLERLAPWLRQPSELISSGKRRACQRGQRTLPHTMNATRIPGRPALALSVGVLLTLAQPCLGSDTVHTGWDLWTTEPTTTFDLANFIGVPLVSYDFGGTLGIRSTGSADTIIQRLDEANGASESIPIEMVALQLMSATPIDLGLGLDFYYITLQSVRGGPSSSGRMTINFDAEGNPHGTFDSFFDVFFDIRLGALDGPIVASDTLLLSQNGALWSHEAPPGALLINGVNHELGGPGDTSEDFWPVGTIREVHPGRGIHVVRVTRVPESGSAFALLFLSILGLVCRVRWPLRDGAIH